MKKIFFLIFISFYSFAQPNYYGAKGTNIDIQIDGDTTDLAWKNATWQSIDKFWIPYDNNLSNGFPTESGTQLWQGDSDFKGKYKILWSSKLNKLVVLIDIIDDFFKDGYVGGSDNYPNYDLPEIFIDEDNSKTKHLYDRVSPFESAESAFAYHIAADKPTVGGVNLLCNAMDISGTYTNSVLLNYAWHFPQFALKNHGNNHYIYEMTLTVYNDTYPADFETYTANLFAGKIMGFALNYCDNDANDNSRDHFISSVTVAGVDNNIAWQTSTVFGMLELLPEPNSVSGFDTLIVKFDKIALTWNQNISNFAINGFYVYKNNVLVGSTTGNSFTISGLTPQTNYKLNVLAFNTTRVSNVSETKVITTKRDFTKGSVNGLDTLFETHQKLGLTWNMAVYNLTVKGFSVFQNNVLIGTTTGNTFTVSGLNATTTYTFTVIAFDKNGNQSLLSFPKTVTTKAFPIINSIDDLSQQSEKDLFVISPNPATEFLQIFNKEQIAFEATIYNIYGQKIKTTYQNTSPFEINIKNIQNGVYFLHIYSQNSHFIKRFLKI
ncbi:MAG: T9SS C-terminal target domain-containing protein [Bacteroidetes bacterium]|nr:MAG: T9SS C-terminal target domain-containing protein [Bacteroidota bacterium]